MCQISFARIVHGYLANWFWNAPCGHPPCAGRVHMQRANIFWASDIWLWLWPNPHDPLWQFTSSKLLQKKPRGTALLDFQDSFACCYIANIHTIAMKFNVVASIGFPLNITYLIHILKYSIVWYTSLQVHGDQWQWLNKQVCFLQNPCIGTPYWQFPKSISTDLLF